MYIYTLFYYVTGRGTNIRVAQYIFVAIYLLQMCLVLRLYSKSRKLPPYVLVISTFTSYRIHSIYVLRLFNDPIAILFLYAAINAYTDGKWTLGSVMLSLGVSIKMNVLLFAPAILLMYIVNLGYLRTIYQLTICGGIQLLLGAPFLLRYPIEYVKGAFNLGRIFDHKWTVNYRFLSRNLFENQLFHIALLIVHVMLLAIFFKPCYTFVQSYCRLRHLEKQFRPQINAKNAELKKMKKLPKSNRGKEEKLTGDQEKFLNSFEETLKKSSTTATADPIDNSPSSSYEIYFDKSIQLILLPLFLSNFIGIICARSLHYQFYVWYYHSLPYLIWYTNYNVSGKFLLLGLAEYAWNTYPSTTVSSSLLHIFHVSLLYGIARKMFHGTGISQATKNENAEQQNVLTEDKTK